MAHPLGLTYDAGALIALERGDRSAWTWHRAALRTRRAPTVPTVALAEAWRDGRQAKLARTLRQCWVDPLDEAQARRAGRALGRAGSDRTLDAYVLASAARRGDAVLTGDPDDLRELQPQFPGVVVVGLRG